MSISPSIVLSTTGSGGLADDIYRSLKTRLECVDRGKTVVNRYSNQNLDVIVPEVRGKNVVVVHTQVPRVNDNFMELLSLLHAVKHSSPANVLLVFPYMPYARSDRKNKPRVSAMGVLIPQIITTHLLRKIDKVLLLDPHCTQTKQYFDPFAEEVTASYLFADHMLNGFISEYGRDNCALVFADAGSGCRYERLSELLGIATAFIVKTRCDDNEKPCVKEVVGDIRGKHCAIVDDEILTGSTVEEDTKRLIESGAASVQMYAVHPILNDRKANSKAVVRRLADSSINQLIVTDSVPVRRKVAKESKFEVLTIAPLLAEAISRIILGNSISDLYKLENVSLYRE